MAAYASLKTVPAEVVGRRLRTFEAVAAQRQLAATPQRRIIYRVIAESAVHPQPEAIYERVRREIPSISLATVYKNIRTFAQLGLLREVGAAGGSMRVDANLDQHHHLVCVRCKAVVDFYDPGLDRIRASRANPKKFRILRYQVEALGLCPDCQVAAVHSKRRKTRWEK